MKITFVTFHNWETKRLGGFHKLAEAAAAAGHDTVFFSFARPYYIFFKREERLNKKVLRALSKGTIYKTDEKGHTIINCTWPTLRVPQPLHKYLPNRINRWLDSHSLTSFSSFNNKFLRGSDIFVFESCEGVWLLDKIKKHNPDAKIIYRPSDPLMVNEAFKNIETKILSEADLALIVNEAGLSLYRNAIDNFDKKVNYKILPNGADVDKFTLKYEKPLPLQKKNTALYVGARAIEWSLILKCGKELPNINFIIVCPENAPQYFLRDKTPNIEYVNGISPDEVPAWVTNCDVIIVPNPKGMYKSKTWGITAKYYQAMAARKPIVAFDDTAELQRHNVDVCYTYDEFKERLNKAMQNPAPRTYKLAYNSWNRITEEFLELLCTIS